jgi:hypothetical protein
VKSRWEKSLSIKSAARLTACVALAILFPLLSAAQQSTPPSNPDLSGQTQSQTAGQDQAPPSTQQKPADHPPGDHPPADQPQTGKDKKEQEPAAPGTSSGTSNDRLFKVLPNFLTLENGGKLPPLTSKQKFAVVARGTFDPVQFPWWGLLAAISQAENSEPAYGQGWEAYGKRYATTAADSIIENFMTQAIFASALRQDPRFFQSGKGGFGRRSWYAVSRIFVTRTDSGHSQFNYSEVFGAATAAGISTYSYHPRSTRINNMFVGSDRTLTNALNVWGTQVGLDTVTIVIKEFWPDVRRKMSHKHNVDTENTAPPTSKP